MLFHKALTFLGFITVAASHFILETPAPIGFDDDNQGVNPCGGLAPNDRSGGVTWWPHKGGPVGLITTHSESVWEFKGALLSNTNKWVNLSRNITQTGVGSFCIPNIPGKLLWAGRRGVIQIIQHGHHGALYSCAAVRFTIGPKKPVDPTVCFNDTGIVATWGNPEHDDEHEHEHKLLF